MWANVDGLTPQCQPSNSVPVDSCLVLGAQQPQKHGNAVVWGLDQVTTHVALPFLRLFLGWLHLKIDHQPSLL
jgi:hypothetical protein